MQSSTLVPGPAAAADRTVLEPQPGGLLAKVLSQGSRQKMVPPRQQQALLQVLLLLLLKVV
jgi:hypothetical protein